MSPVLTRRAALSYFERASSACACAWRIAGVTSGVTSAWSGRRPIRASDCASAARLRSSCRAISRRSSSASTSPRCTGRPKSVYAFASVPGTSKLRFTVSSGSSEPVKAAVFSMVRSSAPAVFTARGAACACVVAACTSLGCCREHPASISVRKNIDISGFIGVPSLRRPAQPRGGSTTPPKKTVTSSATSFFRLILPNRPGCRVCTIP